MKRRKLTYLGLTIIITLCYNFASAQSIFDYNGITYKVLKEADEASTFGTVAVTAKSDGSYNGTITIPNAIKQSDDEYADTYKVVAVDNHAFKGSTTLAKVILPMTIESIGKGAFEECSQLTQVDIPKGNLTQIGENAFAFSGLKSINLPEGITEIPDFAFMECRELEQITLPISLKRIGINAFRNCLSLKNITLPENLLDLGGGTFGGCGLKSIRIPDRIVSILPGTFQECRDLKQVTLPESLLKIGSGAFSLCQSLKSIALPKNLQEIEIMAFSYCGLTKITLSDKIVSIPMYAFMGCFDLEEVTFSPYTTSIGSGAFEYCGKLSKINNPECLKNIGDDVFGDYCILLPDYYLSETQAQRMKDLKRDESEGYLNREELLEQMRMSAWK